MTARMNNTQNAFRFMDLPLELRNQVYRYLLVTKYTKQGIYYSTAVSGDVGKILRDWHS